MPPHSVQYRPCMQGLYRHIASHHWMPILCYCLFLFLMGMATNLSAQESISINADQKLLDESITQLAIQDVQNLLANACQCTVNTNDTKAGIQINLPSTATQDKFDKIIHQKDANGVPHFYYPSSNFKWESQTKNEQVHLNLNTTSYAGTAAALYALLQEQLGFRFYHPRKTIVPTWTEFPISDNWTWEGKERFLKRGFHLHTMHPIELTEALLDHNFPNGIEMVHEYIDWLARNGQNYFEFNLLNSVDLKKWVPYSKQMVDYAHQRGIIMGLDISLHMIQQKAFMLYQNAPASFKSKRKQILANLNALQEANWDVYNIELSSTEYTSGNLKRREKLKKVILDWAAENQVKIMGRAHVVKKGEAVLNYSGASQAQDAERGVMIHTVMFYEIAEEKAPVYGNANLRHMLDLMDKEQPQRETWYFPESAYWVTFDNSVPMFLLPYLSARLNDILLMEQKGITGHLTFSSGWEWGYWLIDWSIARWSWDYGTPAHALDSFDLIFENKDLLKGVNDLLNLQTTYLKDQELMRYMVAQSVLDEVPKMFSREFHPRPRWTYKDLFRKVDALVLDSLKTEGILPLQKFSTEGNTLLQKTNVLNLKTKEEKAIWEELKDGIAITHLRAQHRHACLSAIYHKRMAELDKILKIDHQDDLKKAAQYRADALQIVRKREAEYAYDKTILTTQRPGHTSYHFGYLFPVTDLHFWEREEAQIKENRWGFGFKSIWNIRRIMGISK